MDEGHDGDHEWGPAAGPGRRVAEATAEQVEAARSGSAASDEGPESEQAAPRPSQPGYVALRESDVELLVGRAFEGRSVLELTPDDLKLVARVQQALNPDPF